MDWVLQQRHPPAGACGGWQPPEARPELFPGRVPGRAGATAFSRGGGGRGPQGQLPGAPVQARLREKPDSLICLPLPDACVIAEVAAFGRPALGRSLENRVWGKEGGAAVLEGGRAGHSRAACGLRVWRVRQKGEHPKCAHPPKSVSKLPRERTVPRDPEITCPAALPP